MMASTEMLQKDKINSISMASHDRDIREPLFDFLEEKYGKIRILEEKNIGRVRADVVMVTPDALFGIEIKSDNDTYERLKKQVRNYNQYYDYNIIVVGSRHALHVFQHVSDWWGIISVEEIDGKLDFYVVREPLQNPKVKPEKKIEILWRPEIARIQEKNHLPKYKEKSKRFVQEVLLSRVPPEILWPEVSEELFERDYNTISEEIREFKKK